MTIQQKMLADVMLLKKIDRNLFSLGDAVAVRFGRLIRGKILQKYGCSTVAECTAKIYRDLEKYR